MVSAKDSIRTITVEPKDQMPISHAKQDKILSQKIYLYNELYYEVLDNDLDCLRHPNKTGNLTTEKKIGIYLTPSFLKSKIIVI